MTIDKHKEEFCRTCLVRVKSTDKRNTFNIPKIGTLLRVNATEPNGLFVTISEDVYPRKYINSTGPNIQYWLDIYFVDENRTIPVRAEWFDEAINLWYEI